MKVLISGVCGFVGNVLARAMGEQWPRVELWGIDNLSRAGSESNRAALLKRGVKFRHGDLRLASDLEGLPAMDWVIDASANPSVLAGVDGRSSSRQVVEHNLFSTVNLLEFCKASGAGFILLSTSRVYSIKPLAALEMEVHERAFRPVARQPFREGLSVNGIAEHFSTAAPVSLYGATKLASETLALEYAEAFGLPVWINRCGVLAGAGQFGRADQGIFAFWVNAWLRQAPLKYIGFGGRGWQVRDALHPRDLLPVLRKQMGAPHAKAPRIVNLGGGVANSMSLAQLSGWCAERFGARRVAADSAGRPHDLPWVVMDTRLAEKHWDWRVQTPLPALLEEIAAHAQSHPDWLELSSDQPRAAPPVKHKQPAQQ